MSNRFLTCPRCGGLKFYARGEDGEMFFFQVNTEHWPVPTEVNMSDLSQADFSPIHCTGCSWSGEMRALCAADTSVQ